MKSSILTYWPFSAAPPIHCESPIIRSHSLPFELSSLSMRSAKFGHGTNSNFMPTPLLAVKSFDSSTSALAGSQAAQHKVIVFGWADAGAAGTSAATAASAAAPNRYFVMGCFPPSVALDAFVPATVDGISARRLLGRV